MDTETAGVANRLETVARGTWHRIEKPAMLWVDPLVDRRLQAFLARNFSMAMNPWEEIQVAVKWPLHLCGLV